MTVAYEVSEALQISKTHVKADPMSKQAFGSQSTKSYSHSC